MYINAHISIDMDAAELQTIGELLVETYMHHNFIHRVPTIRSVILSKIKGFSYNVLQLIGVTLSLIAANVLSPLFGTMFDSTTTSTTSTSITLPVRPANAYSKMILDPFKMCPHDFGCDRNICWRSCTTNGKEGSDVSWCYTTSNLKSTEYNQCIHQHDCSACWECLGPCHSPQN